jgi:single-strand DNA-binding protein
MGIENSCTFIGRLGDDPIIRESKGEKPMPVANFSIAVNERYGKSETTTWVNMVAWNGLATIVEKFCKKGSKIVAQGRLQNRTWEGKDGTKRYQTEVILSSMHLAGSSGNGGSREYPPLPDEPPMGAVPPEPPQVSDADIPF